MRACLCGRTVWEDRVGVWRRSLSLCLVVFSFFFFRCLFFWLSVAWRGFAAVFFFQLVLKSEENFHRTGPAAPPSSLLLCASCPLLPAFAPGVDMFRGGLSTLARAGRSAVSSWMTQRVYRRAAIPAFFRGTRELPFFPGRVQLRLLSTAIPGSGHRRPNVVGRQHGAQ